MKKLEIKHLALYSPYGLKCTTSDSTIDGICGNRVFFDGGDCYYWLSEIKPILRLLSSATKQDWYDILKSLDLTDCLENIDIDEDRVNITWSNGESYEYYHSSDASVYFSPFSICGFEDNGICPFEFREELLSRHYDIFGLIEKGLAIRKEY